MKAVKRSVKKLLARLRLLDIVQRLYFNLKTANPSVIRREWQYRSGHSSTESPPPPQQIFDVIATRWAAIYFDSGKIIVSNMEEILQANHLSLGSFESILDFGCGCGRLIQQMRKRTGALLIGSDYNPTLIGWCAEHLTFAEFHTNELSPPLNLAEESVDFAYARSVLTHLPEELQIAWMEELRRVLRPGGYLYFSMHGRYQSRRLPEPDRKRFARDELVVTHSSFAGQNLCSTYATLKFVEGNLLNGFTLVDSVEGRNQEHLKQDVYLVRKD